MKKSVRFSCLSLLALAAACSPDNPRLVAPPATYEEAVNNDKQQKAIVVRPQVDILVVMDNSGSMLDEQTTLSKNIDQFANGLAKNGNVDFHIGVVSVWDSITFKEMQKEYAHGQLRRLKDPNGHPMPETFPPFVSSTQDYDSYLAGKGYDLKSAPGWIQVLRSSMKIGTEGYNSKWREEKKGGPNIEEVFSPVKMALSPEMKAGANKDFRRNGVPFVMIFVTDADASVRNAEGTTFDLSGGDLQEFLANELGPNYRDLTTAIGVLAKLEDPDKEKDPGIKGSEPVNIMRFIKDMGGRMMGLRDADYGTQMANLGQYVRERAMSKPRIDLSGHEPDIKTLSVELAGKPLKAGIDWTYDDNRRSVTILGDLSDASGVLDLQVKFTAVKAKDAFSGRVKKQ